jgi:hypothetical protein
VEDLQCRNNAMMALDNMKNKAWVSNPPNSTAIGQVIIPAGKHVCLDDVD